MLIYYNGSCIGNQNVVCGYTGNVLFGWDVICPLGANRTLHTGQLTVNGKQLVLHNGFVMEIYFNSYCVDQNEGLTAVRQKKNVNRKCFYHDEMCLA